MKLKNQGVKQTSRRKRICWHWQMQHLSKGKIQGSHWNVVQRQASVENGDRTKSLLYIGVRTAQPSPVLVLLPLLEIGGAQVPLHAFVERNSVKLPENSSEGRYGTKGISGLQRNTKQGEPW